MSYRPSIKTSETVTQDIPLDAETFQGKQPSDFLAKTDETKFRRLVNYGKPIPDNTNLNTLPYTEIGTYYVEHDANAQTLENCPTTSSFMLEVICPNGNEENNSVWRLRVLTTYKGKVYTQYVNLENGGTYYEWCENLSADEISAKFATKNEVSAYGYNVSKTTIATTTQYFKLATLPLAHDSDANSASIVINGRLGGFVKGNNGLVSMLIGNRNGEYGFVACYSDAGYNFERSDIEIYRQEDGSAIIYIRVSGYYSFDLNVQIKDTITYDSHATFDYNGTPEEPIGALMWKASTATNKLEVYDGKAFANSKQLAFNEELAKYLPLTGGLMTGPLRFNGQGNMPHESNAKYIVTLEAFGAGPTNGQLKYTDLADLKATLGVVSTLATQADNGLMSAADKKKLDREVRSLVASGTQITKEGTDLNTIEYLKVGTYYCVSSSLTASFINCPSAGNAFMMEVLAPINKNYDDEKTSTYCYRVRIITNVYGQSWYQNIAIHGTALEFTYSDWIKVADSNDLKTYLKTTDISSWAKATSKPSYTWNEIGSKPTNATTTTDGFMSSGDKSHLDSMWNVWTADGTSDTLVNKIEEVLKVFENFPESSNLVTLLAGKQDKITSSNKLSYNLLSDTPTIDKLIDDKIKASPSWKITNDEYIAMSESFIGQYEEFAGEDLGETLGRIIDHFGNFVEKNALGTYATKTGIDSAISSSASATKTETLNAIPAWAKASAKPEYRTNEIKMFNPSSEDKLCFLQAYPMYNGTNLDYTLKNIVDDLMLLLDHKADNSDLKNYVTNSALTTKLADYATKTSLGDYATKASLADYVTTDVLETYATTDSVNKAIANAADTIKSNTLKEIPSWAKASAKPSYNSKEIILSKDAESFVLTYPEYNQGSVDGALKRIVQEISQFELSVQNNYVKSSSLSSTLNGYQKTETVTVIAQNDNGKEISNYLGAVGTVKTTALASPTASDAPDGSRFKIYIGGGSGYKQIAQAVIELEIYGGYGRSPIYSLEDGLAIKYQVWADITPNQQAANKYLQIHVKVTEAYQTGAPVGAASVYVYKVEKITKN